MKSLPKKLILFVIAAVLLMGWTPEVIARESLDSVRLIKSDEQGVVFHVEVPWDKLTIEKVEVNGQSYIQMSLEGWSAGGQEGAPELPYLSQVLGIPFDAQLSIQVVPGDYETMPIEFPVLPVRTQEFEMDPDLFKDGPSVPVPSTTYAADDQIYGADQDYPNALAEIINEGVFRGQRVASIAVYPIQFNPSTSSLRIYKDLQVMVQFSGSNPSQLGKTEDSAIFELLYQESLLNYESARQWRSFPNDTIDLESERVEGLAGTDRAITPWMPPAESWRIRVGEDGMYQLGYTDLSSAGVLDTMPDPRNFHLYHQGMELAIEVVGEDDGVFDAADTIIFYGQGISSKYTNQNVYWLSVEESPGLRMGTQSGAPSSAESPSVFQTRHHMENNIYYLTNYPGDDNTERFLWDYISTQYSKPSWSYSIFLKDPNPSQSSLAISLYGYISSAAYDPDHHVVVTVNGVPVGDGWWDGTTIANLYFEFSGLLVPGENTITVTCPNDTGLGYDYVLVDWLELDFTNNFTAEGDTLPFDYAPTGTWLYQVEGFTGDHIAAYDITQPNNPSKFTGLSITPSGDLFTLEFEDEVLTTKSYVAIEDSAYKTVDGIEKNEPSNLQAEENQADYILITHKDFWDAAQVLAAHHTSQGLNVLLADVQDVYDEFGYGVTGVQPIHDFIAYAYASWNTSYVLLMGDGHYDPKDFMGYGRTSFIPPYLGVVDPWIGETAADNRYVTVTGADTMPDLMIGRLPVNTIDEATTFVNKIISYNLSPEPGDWQTHLLTVADNADSGGNFPVLSDGIIDDLIPSSFETTKVYYGVTHSVASEAKQAVLSAINNGVMFVNFIGHAAYTQWANENLLNNTDIPTLTNDVKQPIVLAMTCYEGYFHRPGTSYGDWRSLAEVFTNTTGRGAIASWSPTGLGVASGHDYLNRGFYNAYFHLGAETIGEATLKGKFDLWSSGISQDLLDTYTLFGDPGVHFISGGNSQPITVEDNYSLDAGEILSISAPGVLANDSDPDGDLLTAHKQTDPLHGSVTLNADGSFIYTPNEGFSGEDSFTYKASDSITESSAATVTINVNKKAATVTLTNLTQTYDGDPKPVIVTTTPPGLTVSVTYNGSATVPVDAGTYTVVATIVDDVYQGSAEETLTINAKPLTVTADAKEKVYGEDDPPLTFQVTPDLITGDSFSGTLSRTGDQDVGVYTIQQGTLTAGANYMITFVSADFTITARAITITADDQEKVVDTSDPELTYTITSGGLVYSDTVSGELTRDAGETVGDYTIRQGTLGISDGNGGNNYDLTFIEGTLTIKAGTVAVTVDAGQTKVYGESDPVFTYTVSDPLVPLTGQLSRVAGEDVGTYAITIGTLSAGEDYAIELIPADFSITAKPLTVTADAKEKVYGEDDPPLTFQVTPSLVTGNSFSGTLTRTGDQDVGTYAIQQGTLTAGSNYVITFVPADFSITARAITITADDQEKVVDTSDPALTYTITSGGLAYTDTITGELTRNPGESVGDYLITQGTLGISDGNAGNNYDLTFIEGLLRILEKSGITIYLPLIIH